MPFVGYVLGISKWENADDTCHRLILVNLVDKIDDDKTNMHTSVAKYPEQNTATLYKDLLVYM